MLQIVDSSDREKETLDYMGTERSDSILTSAQLALFEL